MSDTVWVIEEGSYSDYHVVGIYRTREDAEVVLAKIAGGYGDAKIAEWPLNPGVEDVRAGLVPYSITMAPDGTTERCEKEEWSSYRMGDTLTVWRRSQAPAYRGKGVTDAVHGTVFARDAAHAVKIANEHRLRFIEACELVDQP